MEDQESRVKVSIMGEDFTILSNADSKRIRLIETRLNEAVNKITSANRRLPPKSAMILVAFNLMDDLIKIEEDYSTLIGYLEGGVLDEAGRILSDDC